MAPGSDPEGVRGIWTPPGEWASFARHEGLGEHATDETYGIHEATGDRGGVRGGARRRDSRHPRRHTSRTRDAGRKAAALGTQGQRHRRALPRAVRRQPEHRLAGRLQGHRAAHRRRRQRAGGTSRRPGAAELEFRDIEAFDARRAVVLAIGEGEASRVFRTDDGGATWTESFRNTDPRAFYDCLTFFDRRHGLAMSDPVDGKFRILSTSDGGRSWKVLPSDGHARGAGGRGGLRGERAVPGQLGAARRVAGHRRGAHARACCTPPTAG